MDSCGKLGNMPIFPGYLWENWPFTNLHDPFMIHCYSGNWQDPMDKLSKIPAPKSPGESS